MEDLDEETPSLAISWFKNNRDKWNKYQRDYYQTHKEKQKAANTRYKNKTKPRERFIVFNHYSNGDIKCSCCGERIMEFLTIDHINGGGSKHRDELKKYGYEFYHWLIKMKLPTGYQVQCMNCNWGRRFSIICPHKKLS